MEIQETKKKEWNHNMKFEKLIGDRFKEKPSDCSIDSHALMIRGGYMKYVANGIFSSYPPLKRITKKIEQIIREEMDKIDGQEVLFPVVYARFPLGRKRQIQNRRQ